MLNLVDPKLKGFTASDVLARLEGRAPSLALFTTFTFSPSAFQEQYVRPLQRVGCERIVVLVDPLGFRQSLGEAAVADGAGTFYRVRCVPRNGAFHAKLALLVTDSRTIMAVGSGNLTAEGLRCNAEVGVLATIDDAAERSAASDFSARLLAIGRLATAGTTRSRLAMGGGSELLTSLDSPILSGVTPPDGLEEIVVTSPFVDSLPSLIKALRGAGSRARVRVRIDPKYGCLTRDLLRTLPANVSLEVPRDRSDEKQPFRRPRVHGKCLVMIGASEGVVILGSANATAAGLLETANFEAVVCHRTTRARAISLDEVEGVRWRRAKPEDATDPFPRAENVATSGLVAELRARTLSLHWASSLPSDGRLQIETGAGRHDLGALVGHRGAEDSWDAEVDVPATAVSGARPGGIAKLVFAGGRSATGWIDVLAILESPPELRQQARILSDLFERPEETDDADVEAILVMLRRDLEAPRQARHVRGRDVAGAEGVTSTEFERLSMLDVDGAAAFAMGGQAQSHEGILRVAATRLKELELLEHEGDAPDDADGRPEQPTSGNRRRKSVPGLPTQVARAIERLIESFVERVDAAQSRDDVHALAVRLPTYVDAIEFVHRRYRLSRGWAQSLLLRVVNALTDPGVASSAARSGALLRALSKSTPNAAVLRASARVTGCLAALVLLLYPIAAPAEQARARDRLDLVEAVFGREASTDVQRWLEALLPTIGSAAGAAAPTPLSLGEIRRVDGEVARTRATREALLALVHAVATGTVEAAERLALAERAVGDGTGKTLLRMLSQNHSPGRPIRLRECDVVAENTCAECQFQLPGAELSRLHDPRHVSRCSCGTLLVRRLS